VDAAEAAEPAEPDGAPQEQERRSGRQGVGFTLNPTQQQPQRAHGSNAAGGSGAGSAADEHPGGVSAAQPPSTRLALSPSTQPGPRPSAGQRARFATIVCLSFFLI